MLFSLKGARRWNRKLYDLMDWAGIEELTYSESANPHRMLGPHATEEGLINTGIYPY